MAIETRQSVSELCLAARRASRVLAKADRGLKDRALRSLAEEGQVKPGVVTEAIKKFELDPEKPNPTTV